jgi:hypothetical protein
MSSIVLHQLVRLRFLGNRQAALAGGHAVRVRLPFGTNLVGTSFANAEFGGVESNGQVPINVRELQIGAWRVTVIKTL